RPGSPEPPARPGAGTGRGSGASGVTSGGAGAAGTGPAAPRGGHCQSLPRVSPPAGGQAAPQGEALTPELTEATLPSPRGTWMPWWGVEGRRYSHVAALLNGLGLTWKE